VEFLVERSGMFVAKAEVATIAELDLKIPVVALGGPLGDTAMKDTAMNEIFQVLTEDGDLHGVSQHL